ncbi:glyoxylase-like metal-dependent hydrolase (beta-lactamase superfamily II) [Kushneria sinocarnis]|uniref:Glyoxylase-like metal-dependent hydrolase (Beta-lactamase superfamily II) n=1 Tax=Kushneria sinocarnis TaxID=595502 RepID=A0A420X0A8_9GAMM|nr:N-acyl homoserine lactonase family protein [Kushneria sinocarnis]RKR07288.1 glyoxylase-like metal-dependent hydrolase (beta-lactamase superfamily II) [Kushneria sinocarnis]
MSDIRLYMFQAGSLRQREVSIKLGASHYEFITPIPWFLIMHPRGNVVIDGGTAVEAADDPIGYWGKATDVYWPLIEREEGCVNQLRAHGFKVEDIRYVVQSHLHLDHTGAVGRFPNATHIVQRREYEYAFTADWFAAPGYIRRDIDQPDLDWYLLDAEHTDGFDLFGDGVLKMFYTPGHSPGHQSFLVNLPNTGPMLLAIDAAYTMEHWNEQCLPGFLTSAIEVARSVRKLRMLAEQTGATVVPGHDPDRWPEFSQAPAYYD